MIEAGRFRVGGVPIPKAATLVTRDTPIEPAEHGEGYVGRGALKLEGALEAFPVEVQGRRVLDVGASTGGFTDLLLRRGATEVVALDVGYGQLDQRLRQDPRVHVMERTNVRHTTSEDTGGRFPLIVGDLSFISLCAVAGALAGLAQPGGDLILLVKPQFEAEKRDVPAGGIVRDESVRRQAVEKVIACLAEWKLAAQALTASPLAGAGGNREVFVWCRSGTEQAAGLEVPE